MPGGRCLLKRCDDRFTAPFPKLGLTIPMVWPRNLIGIRNFLVVGLPGAATVVSCSIALRPIPEISSDVRYGCYRIDTLDFAVDGR
jgi:hypothetical protein